MRLTSVVRSMPFVSNCTPKEHVWETVVVTHTLMLAASSEFSQRMASLLMSAYEGTLGEPVRASL